MNKPLSLLQVPPPPDGMSMDDAMDLYQAEVESIFLKFKRCLN